MEARKPAVERIRPILEAMERSIDSARRKRVSPNAPSERCDAVSRNQNPAPPTTHASHTQQANAQSAPGPKPTNEDTYIGKPKEPHASPDDPLRTPDGGRLKARPKARPSGQNFAAQPFPAMPYRNAG